jgi:YidC/Oxa1 family membrane protein insertase
VGQIGYLFNLLFTFPIFNALMLLYHLFGDFGLSIIVLTLVLKLVLFPLTLQQLKSMKATQALQPQMAEIRRKYAKDQQAQAMAMQALYKEYGVNPLAGCLPLLIQLPVLYGLFYALEDVVKTTNHNVQAINNILYPFVPHFSKFPNIDLSWFTFISPAFHISLANPDPTHILPILAALATFVQLRMSQPKAAAISGNANDPSTQSMKMMQYVMPFITLFFGWTFPAGLALYWTVSSIFQAIQQYFVTGWGALLVAPNIHLGGAASSSNKGGSGSSGSNGRYAADTNKGRERTQKRDEADEESADNEGDASVDREPRMASRAVGSASTRRRQSGSASARRRSSNNAQKRKVSPRSR